MFKKVLSHPVVQTLLAYVGTFYIRLVYKTTRWRLERFEVLASFCQAQKPVIVCFWHERLLMAPCGWHHKNPFYMVISGSRDGQLISQVVAPFGIHTIQGSSRRGGSAALKSMLQALKEGAVVGITPDGPKGPRRHLQQGILIAAQMAQVPIVPFAYSTSRGRFLSSWDRFLLPLPFGRGIIGFGDPLPPPPRMEDFPLWTQRLENALTTLTNQMDIDLKVRL